MFKYSWAFWQPGWSAVGKLAEQPLVKTALSVLLYIISTFVHEDATKVLILLSLVLVDMGTGVWVALKMKSFSSSKFRNGIIKLLFYCIIIGAFHALSEISELFKLLHLDTASLVYLSATEVLSIIENSSKILGITIPEWLLGKIKQFITTGKT